MDPPGGDRLAYIIFPVHQLKVQQKQSQMKVKNLETWAQQGKRSSRSHIVVNSDEARKKSSGVCFYKTAQPQNSNSELLQKTMRGR